MLTVDQMNLAPVARRAAEILKTQHPDVVFTSGRRDTASQAHAMATNVQLNLHWIQQTYTTTPQHAALQARCTALGPHAGVDAYAAAMFALMQRWTDEELFHVSAHLGGHAFDVQPVAGPAGETIKASIRALPGLDKFLDHEGGLIRWHAQFG